MTEKNRLELGDVQKTLLLPLWGRAVESRRAKPLLIDDTAVKIIDQIDYDFSQLAHSFDPLTQIAWIMRSKVCDRVIKSFLSSYPNGTIVNIGCGLDTIFDRLDNGQLKWIDLDLPDVIELRRRFINESERRKFIASSFLEESWLNDIQVDSNVLFIAAGVFYYFEEQQIKEFIGRIKDAFPGSELLFDASSPMGVRVANKKVIESSGLDERSYLKWGLEKPQVILSWDAEIRLIGIYYYFRTIRIGIRNVLMGMLSDFLKIQYMLHLKLGNRI